MPGMFSLMSKGAAYVGGVAKTAMKTSPMARHAAMGAGAGAVYGGVSSDTSVMGGALMGAGVGVAAMRYGGAGAKAFRRGRMPGDGSPVWGGRQLAGRMMRSGLGQMKGDALLMSNKAINGFSALRRRMGR